MTDPAVLTAFLDAARTEPDATAILVDFDGTLSPTVADPALARPTGGAVEVLDALARTHRIVAAVSGRPLAFLRPLLPSSITISGQYGLELARPGHEEGLEPDPVWVRAVADAVGLLTAGTEDGVLVEPKGASITVHWRNAPDAEDRVRRQAEAVAVETGLVLHDAKESIELRPAVATDKGTVVTALADDARNVLYLGDDLGDLPAFLALGAMRDAGRTVLRVGVDGPELPDAVRDAVDHLVDGPTGAVALLERLR